LHIWSATSRARSPWTAACFPDLPELLDELAAIVTVQVVTVDSFGRVHEELAGLSCTVTILSGLCLDVLKKQYVLAPGTDLVAAIGNGANDRPMLKAARLGIAAVKGRGRCRGRAERRYPGAKYPGGSPAALKFAADCGDAQDLRLFAGSLVPLWQKGEGGFR